MRSITWRLTMWYAIVLVVILIICGTAAFGVMRYLLLTEAAREVEIAIDTVQHLTNSESQKDNYSESYEHMDLDDPELTSSADYGILWVQITAPDGRVLNSSRSLGNAVLAPRYVGSPTLFNFDGQKVLLAGAKITDGALVQVAKPFGRENNFLKTLASVFGVIALGGLILAITGGRMITRAALRPVQNLTRTAKQISATDLTKRIALSGPQDELHELGNTFNQMLDRLEQGFYSQQEFVAAASHDLRTPLTVIKSYTNLLSRWGKDDPAIVEESVQAMAKAAGTMERLVNDLLLLARIQAKPPLIAKPLLLGELAEETVREAKAVSGHISVKLGLIKQAVVDADEYYLRRALWVLLDNAIKYNHPGGEVEVNVTVNKEKGEAILSVIDTGPGIDEKDLTKIFDRFYRGDPSRSQGKGFGLGLALAKGIVETHGGKITVDSHPGQGSRFNIVLPLKS